MTPGDRDADVTAAVREQPTRVWFLLIAGGVVMMAGATAPWFTVGPASRLGLDDLGWPVLVAGIVVIVCSLVLRRTGDVRWLYAAMVAELVAVATLVVAVATPPTSMSLSAGIVMAFVGSLMVAAGAIIVIRSGRQEAPADVDESSAGDEAEAPATVSAAAGPARTLGRGVGWIALALVGALGVIGCWPVGLAGLDAEPEPTTGYQEALGRFAAVTAGEPDFVYEPCRSRLLDHGDRTAQAVVLFHGLTNCPRQYVEMAESIHEQGANVLILRAPGHGHAEDDGERIAGGGALHSLNAEQLADYADDAVDIATGLGDEVLVHGLSMGGVIALWTAQFRPDVSRVVALAPAFELPIVPNAISAVFTNIFARVPSITRSHDRRIDHDYAAESSRGLAATFTLGQAVMDEGLDVGPAIDDVIVVLNPDDPLVHEPDIEALVDAWDRTRDVVDVVVIESAGLPHDCIDLAQPKANADAVYPTVLEALGFEWTG